MIKNKDEAKAITEHISCDFKFNGTTCNSKQKWNSKTCQCECKNAKKVIVAILGHVFVRIVSI